MGGETDLTTLLACMEPRLHSGDYVFCTVDREATKDELATAIASLREDEGTTLVLATADAAAMRLTASNPLAWITLTVHSSLDAVGLTAAVATCLAGLGIACNVVAGFHHDHLFVPSERAADAMDGLILLAHSSRSAP